MGRVPKNNLAKRFSDVLQQIGLNIRYHRQEKNLTQAELARRAGISNTTLNEIETRQFRDIRLSTLSALAQALDVPLIHLIRDSDVEISSRDHATLLKATESILRITQRLR